MASLRRHLSYANVMSTLFVFLALGGATAFAATQLAKNSVGSKQLKKSSVTAAKIKKNAVTKAKIKNGSINSAKVADGSLTGTDINAASTPFSHVVAHLQSNAQQQFGTTTFYPLGSFTQAAGEDDQFIGSMTVNFAASCAPKRGAGAFLLIDPPANIAEFSPSSILGFSQVSDTSTGAKTVTAGFTSYVGFGSMARLEPAADITHSLALLLVGSECESGSGVSATGATVDVIGTK